MNASRLSLLPISAALLILISCDGPGNVPPPSDDGRVIRTDQRFVDDRGVLSPPILREPIYECTEGVWVSGFKPDATIEIFIAGMAAPVGSATSKFTSGEGFKVSVTFKAGMVVTARQVVNGIPSGPSNAVTVRNPRDDYPGGWPAPQIDPPPVYRCGRAIGSRNQLNGSLLSVLQERRRPDGAFDPPATVGTNSNAQPWTYAFTSPFEPGARIRVRYRLCEQDSPLSAPETAQSPPPIPPPSIDQGYENQSIVVVRNTVNGSNLEVFRNAVASTNRVGGQPTPGGAPQQILVNPPAAPGVPLIPTAALCDPPTVGPPMTPKPCSDLPPAKIKRPAPGDTSVEVTESVPGANIRIYSAGREIGDGGGNIINLIRPVGDGETLLVVQSLGNCTSAWVFEVPVGCSRAGDPNACRADWPAFGHDSTRAAEQPKNSALADPFRVRTLKVKWRYPRNATLNRFRSSPIVHQGVVFVGNADGRFYALDAATGAERWRYPPVGQPPLTSRYAEVGRVNDSGRGLASSGVIARVRREIDVVIFGGPDRSLPPGLGSGRLFALDVRTGAEVWKSPAVAILNGDTTDSFTELHEQIGYSSPVVIGDRVYVGIADHADSPIQNGKVVAVDLNSGALVGGFSYQSTNNRGGGIWSSPAGGPDGELYVTTGNSNIGGREPSPNHGLSLLRLNSATGGVLWKLQPVPYALDRDPDWASGPQSARTRCGSVVASTMKDGWSYAARAGGASPSSPGLLWQFPPTGFPFTTEPPLHGDTRYLVPGAISGDSFITMTGGMRAATTTLDGFNKIHALDICGNNQDPVRWLFDVPDTPAATPYQLGPPTGSRGVFFVGNEAGRLIVFADPSVAPHAGLRCTNPALSNADCVPNGFRLVPQPSVLANIPLNAGGIRTQPALADGRVFVATLGGILFMLEP